MANELSYDAGIPITLTMELANPAASATTVALMGAQGGTGFIVPAGYKFHPVYLSVESNADLTAGTATAKFTAGGSVIAGGPQPVLADAVQRASAVQRVGVAPIAEGVVVKLAIVTDASYAPVTADLTFVGVGLLLPA
jgi:hypothetical protein